MSSDDELPELSSLVLKPTGTKPAAVLQTNPLDFPSLRRSPRKTVKNSGLTGDASSCKSSAIVSGVQKSNLVKTRSPTKSAGTRAGKRVNVLEDMPLLRPNRDIQTSGALLIPSLFSNEQTTNEDLRSSGYTQLDTQLRPVKVQGNALEMLTKSFSTINFDEDGDDSSKENISSRKKNSKSNTKPVQPTSQMSRITQAAGQTSPAKSKQRPGRAVGNTRDSDFDPDMTSKAAQPLRMESPRKQSRQQSRTTRATKSTATSAARRFISHEAFCDDLDESPGSDGEGEDEDTDLSGFIVDDDADISIHISSDSDSEVERRSRAPRPTRGKGTKSRNTKASNDEGEVKPSSRRRRLQRGRKNAVSDSEEESLEQISNKADDGLSNALQKMNLGKNVLENHKNAKRRRTIEVVDLTSSPVQETEPPIQGIPCPMLAKTSERRDGTIKLDIFEDLNDALRLNPGQTGTPSLSIPIPSKSGPFFPAQKSKQESTEDTERPRTPSAIPPATPPRTQSPTKLRSPSKLQLSPSKRGDARQRSPHRQSMDAFWDHEVINEWNDQFSPQKAPIASPRKNPLLRFMQSASWSDSEDELSGNYNESNESSDSLPSPCESPSKSRRAASPFKEDRAEAKRIADEKRARKAEKKAFDNRKEQMAVDLFSALDKYITDSKISSLSASTGGVQIIWSKTLRSTAGRANWRRTVTKPTGSPVKGDNPVPGPGVKIEHFASIELATKVIDRPDRLVNTLAHEFCHLANFMVSGIRDQPHGDSFKRWGAKTTSWMRGQSMNQEWKCVEVTTKHGYVIEHKYLWVCTGRPQSLTMKMLNIEDAEDGGCGAEYGRHSKSIDVDKHRCGRCKGMLVQVRPTPRANSSSPVKSRSLNLRSKTADIQILEKMVELVELSD